MSYIHPLAAEHLRRRWTRHDAWRFAPPGSPEAKMPSEWRSRAALACAARDTEDAEVATELAALRVSHDRLRVALAEVKAELAWRRFVRKFSPDQPRVPAGNPGGGQWTSGPGSGDSSNQPVPLTTQLARLLPGRPGLTPLLPVPLPSLPNIVSPSLSPDRAIALYNRLSDRNTDDARAVLTFNAHAFEPNASPKMPAMGVDRLTRDQVDQVCPRYIEVQSITNEAAQIIDRGAYPSAAAYGTAVHMWVKAEVNGSPNGPAKDPDFRSEYSFIKSRDADYGEPGSKRVDVFENPHNGTICVYDIKTGNSILSFARMQELATAVGRYYPGLQQIVVTEVKPREW